MKKALQNGRIEIVPKSTIKSKLIFKCECQALLAISAQERTLDSQRPFTPLCTIYIHNHLKIDQTIEYNLSSQITQGNSSKAWAGTKNHNKAVTYQLNGKTC